MWKSLPVCQEYESLERIILCLKSLSKISEVESSYTREVSELACRFFFFFLRSYSVTAIRMGVMKRPDMWEQEFPVLSFILCYDSKSSLKIRFINF